MIYTLRK